MSNTIYWMLVDANQTVPEATGALSEYELGKYAAFRFPKRRDEWLLGRWTAKALARSLPGYAQYSLDQIEILNTPEGAPYIQVPGGSTEPGSLTISHSAHMAFCALTMVHGLHVGADLEKIEARTETFVLDYFTPGELRLVEACPTATHPSLVTLVWSAKEAMLKALGVGLRQDTRSVEVLEVEGLADTGLSSGGWQTLQVVEPVSADRTWTARWQVRGGFMLTLAAFAAAPGKALPVEFVEQQT